MVEMLAVLMAGLMDHGWVVKSGGSRVAGSVESWAVKWADCEGASWAVKLGDSWATHLDYQTAVMLVEHWVDVWDVDVEHQLASL